MSEVLVSLVAPDTAAYMAELAASTPPGVFVEVGVYQGGTAQHLLKVANEQGRTLYLYDTFTGIPFKDEIDSHVVGDFRDVDLEKIRRVLGEAVIVQGIFPGSAVPMEKIAFAHLDCDQYRSVKEASLYLAPLMVEGGIMWFDDYPCLAGAKAAVDEVFGDRVENSPHGGKTIVRF